MHALPRLPFPPYPEVYLQAWRFDDPALLNGDEQAALATLNTRWRESWSGFALDQSGIGPALLAIRANHPDGSPNLTMDTGTIRFYFAPEWSSTGKAAEYSSDMRLLEFGAWSENDVDPFAWLGVDATGSTLRLMRQTEIGPVEVLQTPIQWPAGQWHQVALVWTGNGDVHLFLDGQAAATGVGLDFNAMNRLDGMTGFTVGSDLEGSHLAQGQFEELYTFSRACSTEELAWNWRVQKDRAALGPISEEELSERQLSLEVTAQLLPETQSIPPGAALLSLPSCGLWLSIAPVGAGAVELMVHNTTPGTTYTILSRQDVAAGSWIEETTFLGAIGQTDTQVPISMNGRQRLFFGAMEVGPNRIQSENAITGTTDWQLTDPATPGWPLLESGTTPEIEGFASATSVNAGETLDLYVDVRDGSSTFTAEFFRMGWYGGLGARRMGSTVTATAMKQPVPGMASDGLIDCLLPAPANPNGPWQLSHSFAVPSDWLSGVYLAKLTASSSGKQSYIIFVVREDCRSSDFLFQTSVTT